MSKRKNACLVCGEDLKFFESAKELECIFCHEKHLSHASCKNGHYVCDDCHSRQALQSIKEKCLSAESKNPLLIAVDMMKDPYVYMHGNENHVLVGAALLAAYKNAGGCVDLNSAVEEMEIRGGQVPGGACGFWGACGAAISAGIFISIVTGSTPLSKTEWGYANTMTSKALRPIGEIGGPRCCKRNAFLSINEAVEFCSQTLSVHMERSDIICSFSSENSQCIGRRCPFNSSYRNPY